MISEICNRWILTLYTITFQWDVLQITAASASVASGSGNRLTSSSQVDNGCKGVLPLPCKCTAVAVECINGQFTDTDIFLQISKIHFPFLESVNFQGNNFVHLPTNVFGPASNHPRLIALNLSANYFVNMDPDAFQGMPDLRFLDLTDNEIILDAAAVRLLQPLKSLQSLRLRKAFRFPMNVTQQLGLLQSILERAKLCELQHLDLSWNYLDWLPPRLTCSLPALKQLILADNNLHVLDLEPACLQKLVRLDLSRNAFVRIDVNFMRLVSQLPESCAVSLYQNPFHCDCKAVAYLEWLRASAKIDDVELLKCYSASPSHLLLQSLKKVPIAELSCSTAANANSASPLLKDTLFTIFAKLFLLGYIAKATNLQNFIN
ncbi:Leucine-rich repeat and fibronectin type-III domain-containing protein 4 [Trichinella patagoniensis]|uniref:Leucine-rich repeat and fibronectin type-III domain-containing protein 4 n=1 Tax=Trichinella patagoniensis TaxID=990121 RepID=A0A0V0ZNM5_9BILA|nr:Leucine-rich repeat and fibronectin type-III domain-containing protein 4 [Trichinella patagoniensis]